MMDYGFVSVDDHIDLNWLPADLWTSRLPKALREAAPRVVEDDDGYWWVCEDKRWGSWSGGRPKGQRHYYRNALDRGGVLEPGVLRPTIPELRLIDMDRDGLAASFMFGPIRAFTCDDPELRVAIHRAYNDWLAEFCSYDPSRLFGVAALPSDPEDLDEAIAEMRRLADLGALKQVNFLIGRAGRIYTDEWEKFWSAVDETGLIVSLHVGGGNPGGARPGGEHPSIALYQSKNFINAFLDTFNGLLAEGVFDRHSGVKMVLAELGLGWLPWLVQDMDHRYGLLLESKDYWDERGGIHVTMPPSEVWKRNFWVTFQDDPVGLALLDFCNEDHILWASDYPHPDSTFPESRQVAAEQLGGVTAERQRKILRENAVSLYGLESLPA